jgi:hypothetical protein
LKLTAGIPCGLAVEQSARARFDGLRVGLRLDRDAGVVLLVARYGRGGIPPLSARSEER